MRPHRRYSEKEKEILLNTIARARKTGTRSLDWILSELGLTRSVYYDWLGKQKTGK